MHPSTHDSHLCQHGVPGYDPTRRHTHTRPHLLPIAPAPLPLRTANLVVGAPLGPSWISVLNQSDLAVQLVDQGELRAASPRPLSLLVSIRALSYRHVLSRIDTCSVDFLHIHTHSLALSAHCTRTRTHTLSLSHTHTHTHTISLSPSPSPSLHRRELSHRAHPCARYSIASCSLPFQIRVRLTPVITTDGHPCTVRVVGVTTARCRSSLHSEPTSRQRTSMAR